MTLIFSAQGGPVNFFSASDILISSSYKNEDSITPPLRTRYTKDISVPGWLTGFSQKSIIAQSTLIQWAGNYAVAKLIVKAILDQSIEGADLVDVSAVISALQLLPSELADISIHYHFADKNSIHRYRHNCSVEHNNGTAVAVSGSGDYDFYGSFLRPKAENAYAQDDIYWHFFIGSMEKLWSEAINGDNYNFSYGGWLEICYEVNERFAKVPYAIKVWTRDNNGIHCDLPLWFSYYYGYDLTMYTIQYKENSLGSPTASKLLIRDFAGREQTSLPRSQVFSPPAYVCHILLDDLDNVGSLHLRKYSESGIEIDVTDIGIHYEAQKELLDDLLNGKVGRY